MKNLLRVALFALACVGAGCGTTAPEQGDIVMPDIVSTVPAKNANDVPVNDPIVLTFSEAMDTASLKVNSSPAAAFKAVTWSSDNTVATLEPSAPLAFGTAYSLTISGEDLAGNPLPTPTGLAFVTELDKTVPAVVSTDPANDATDVNVNGRVTLVFSMPMDRGSVESAFSVTPAFTCAWAWSADSATVSCTPFAALTYGATYTATLAASARGATGNALVAAHTFRFTAATAPDTTPPTVEGVSPLTDSGNSRRDVAISITFSEQMDPVSTQPAFSINSPASMTGGTFSWNTAGNVMTYTPPTGFAYGDTVSWSLTTLSEDASGNRLAAPTSGSFRVVKQKSMGVPPVAGPGSHGSVSSTGEMLSSFGAGDTASGAYWRGFITFDLSGIPGLVAINEATMSGLLSSSDWPWGLGILWASSVDYGAALSFDDFDGPVDTFQGPCPDSKASCSHPYRYWVSPDDLFELNVTDKVSMDLMNQATRQKRSQFRLNFEINSDNDGVEEIVSLEVDSLYLKYEYSW